MPRRTAAEAQQGAVDDCPLSMPAKNSKRPRSPDFRLKSRAPRETDEQVAMFQHAAIMARTDPRWGMLFAIPNGMAASSIREAVNAKRAGLKRGVPDIFLAVPAGGYAGLFLELKRLSGSPADLSPEQRDWLQRLQAQGYQTVVAYGWREAAAEIGAYLGDVG